ncbi:MAG: hypothetical protein ACKVS6_14390 [Planctomycetota bacterium]
MKRKSRKPANPNASAPDPLRAGPIIKDSLLAARELKKFRKGNRLPSDITIREMINEGRR